MTAADPHRRPTCSHARVRPAADQRGLDANLRHQAGILYANPFRIRLVFATLFAIDLVCFFALKSKAYINFYGLDGLWVRRLGRRDSLVQRRQAPRLLKT